MKIQRQISFTTSKNFLQQTITCLVFSITLISQQAFAQVVDSFTDENFTANPTWSGDTTRFVVTAGELKLQAPAVGSSAYLSTPSEAVNDASWEFLVRLNFNPSGTNYTRIYLMSDQANLGGNLNGYFVLIGDTPDEVSLYRQAGATRTKIINGLDGRVNMTTVVVKIKVTRDASGNWNLYSDVGATGTYTSEGSTQDAAVIASRYMGVYCLYTATRSDKFLFDDFVVTGDPFQDNIPPVWQSVSAKDAQTVELTFNENLDAASAENPLNYSIANGIHPGSAELHVDEQTVTLLFAAAMTNGESYMLTVSGVKDVDGNEMAIEAKSFLYFVPVQVQPKDIIVTEIFADPQPVIGLPNAEYIEIFNRSNAPFDLENWMISDGSSVAILPKRIIKPFQYVLLIASPHVSLYNLGEQIIGVSNFPTLNNDSDHLILKDATGVMIDSVRYADSWYLDEDKKLGGWSLELIDVQNICAEQTNWIASENTNGGTPGAQNSVYANKPDVTGPKIISAIPKNQTQLIVEFNEKLDKQLPSPVAFQIEPGIHVVSILFSDPTLTSLTLNLADALQSGIIYQITSSSVFDCAGNEIGQTVPVIFGLPQEADSLDVVINEVLFNPRPTGVDFIEIYNKSSKFINLKDWKIANTENGSIANQKAISEKDLLVAPSAYLVFTTQSNVLKGEYIAAHEENFVEVAALPSMNDDEGDVIIIDNQARPLDSFHYTDKMHSAFIKDEEGVSLERISFENATYLGSNWKSASSTSGFATPGYLNSNNTAFSSDPDAVMVEPEIFQPVIGQPDFTQIHYRFDQGGFIANVKIYDHLGRVIKELANNEVLGTQGSFRWDGDDQHGVKARIGYYMVWFEVFDENGTVQTFRRRVAVGGKL